MPSPSSEQDDVISQINITPLVDIILVILLVFIVTTSMVMKSSIDMSLPKASSGQEVKEELINIALTKEGVLYIDGKPSQFDEIAVYFDLKKKSLSLEEYNNISVLVSSDSEVNYGDFVKVLDQIREDGIVNISLDVSPINLEE